MLYHLLYPLSEQYSIFNVLRYLTFRSMVAFLLTLALVLFFEPRFIAWFSRRRIGQPIRDDGPQSHLVKAGTPTMGGLVVVLAIAFSTLMLAELSNYYVWAALFVMLGYGALGFADDYLKVSKKNTKGVSARSKMFWQIAIAGAAVSMVLTFVPSFSTVVQIPFLKSSTLDLGIWFVPFAVLVIVGASNAVNLTDGLDGLVSGPVVSVAFAYGVFAYVAGNAKIAEYLQIAHLAGAGDLTILASAIIAGALGFLWFNAFPAQVFMGDVGALALGGVLGALAVFTKQELLLVLAGGVFVVEAASVIIQVTSFKMRGKRVFKMAPLHHHFELGGMPEPKIIVRCWIVSLVLAIAALATLKLR